MCMVSCATRDPSGRRQRWANGFGVPGAIVSFTLDLEAAEYSDFQLERSHKSALPLRAGEEEKVAFQ